MFLCRASWQIPVAPSGASLLCLTAPPYRAFGASLPFGLGKVVRCGGASGVVLAAGAWWARGHENAWGVAGEWAEPKAGERAGARGVG